MPPPDEEQHLAIASGSTSTAGEGDGRATGPASSINKGDPRHPFNWPRRKKWTVTLTACLICFVAGINSTSFTTAATDINARFGQSDDNAAMLPVSYWPVTAWNAGAAVFPMVMLPIVSNIMSGMQSWGLGSF